MNYVHCICMYMYIWGQRKEGQSVLIVHRSPTTSNATSNRNIPPANAPYVVTHHSSNFCTYLYVCTCFFPWGCKVGDWLTLAKKAEQVKKDRLFRQSNLAENVMDKNFLTFYHLFNIFFFLISFNKGHTKGIRSWYWIN